MSTQIATRPNGELRDFTSAGAMYGGYAIPTWAEVSGGRDVTNRMVTVEGAAAIPAFSMAIWLVAVNVARMPLTVYSGVGADRVPVPDSWQSRLLSENPHIETTPFDFIYDLIAGVEAYGNAFAQKIKSNGKVVEMHIINPDYVRIRRGAGGSKVFDINVNGKTTKGLTVSDIFHLRGDTMDGRMSGMSPIEVFRNKLGQILAADEYQGRYFANDATPSGYITVPGKLKKQDAVNMLRTWERQHGGLNNAGRPALLYDGAKFDHIGMTMNDSQWVQSQRFSVEEIARIQRVPSLMLQAPISGRIPTTEETMLDFVTVFLTPRVEKLESALASDPDLFLGTGLDPEFKPSALLKTDTKTMWSVAGDAVANGLITKNEGRALIGYGPVAGGDVIMETPRGSAPNTGAQPTDVTPLGEDIATEADDSGLGGTA